MDEPRWCRHLSCVKRATYQGVVTNPEGRATTVHYCDKHLSTAAENIDQTPGVTLTDVRPIEKGTTMKYPVAGTRLRLTAEATADPNTLAAKEGATAIVISHEEASALGVSLVSLTKAASKPSTQVLVRWDDTPERNEQNHGAYPTSYFEVVPDFVDPELVAAARAQADRRTIYFANEQIGDLKSQVANMQTINEQLVKQIDGLVKAVHVLGDNLEDDGQDDEAAEIDSTLVGLDLPPRKQTYTIEILVPTRLHLHVEARSKEHARIKFEAGEVDWNITDGEIQDDDIKVLDISEGSL